MKGKNVVLLTLPPRLAAELREANRKLPNPGDGGVCTDFEAAGPLVPNDSLEVRFADGRAAGETVWLPKFCFRIL